MVDQKETAILALLGPAKTFSDIAADKYLKSSKKVLEKMYLRSIEECFDIVEKGEVESAIVPVENILNGTVREVLDNLFSKKVHITGEIVLPIHHCLVALPGVKMDGIETVSSHPQALKQCQQFINKKLPGVALEGVSSTALALQKLSISKDGTRAAIASQEAAEISGLKIIAKNIEDKSWNSTTFLILEKGEYDWKKPKKEEQKNSTKTSIAFHFKKDKPGSLFKVFKEFAARKISLSRVESRPAKAHYGGYIFFLDVAGGLSSKNVLTAIKSTSKIVAKLKVLGSY